jgi:hypothetical protein
MQSMTRRRDDGAAFFVVLEAQNFSSGSVNNEDRDPAG